VSLSADLHPAACAAVAAGLRLRYPAARRLRDSASFTALSRPAPGQGRCWRATRHWVSVAARVSAAPSPAPAATAPRSIRSRFGVTVGKRNAPRSVDRSLVKRVLREAARRAAAALDDTAGAQGMQLDVVLRLKAAVPAAGVLARSQLKRELRAEADALLALLMRQVSRSTAAEIDR
jgi:ribonuclease P protein component